LDSWISQPGSAPADVTGLFFAGMLAMLKPSMSWFTFGFGQNSPCIHDS
jgi:hypothetical protein